jgi:pimeloyl-ACP methyl ester carboxylesterase
VTACRVPFSFRPCTIFLVILAVLIVAAAGVYVAFARDLSAARARLVGHSETLQSSVGTLEYSVVGAGEPILALHGAGGGYDQAIDMTGALARYGYRLIAPSRFGYLRSSFPNNLTVSMQADAYVELLDHLGIDTAVVVGISAGAWSAMQFAIRHPQRCRALVLIVPADYLPEGTAVHGGAFVNAMIGSDFFAWAALRLMPIMPGAMSGKMLGTAPCVVRSADDAEKARIDQLLAHLLPVAPRYEGMQFDIKTAAVRASYSLQKIACPVLTISAEDDQFGTAARARYIANNVAHGRALIFSCGGHALVGHYADALRESVAFIKSP